MNNTFQKIVKTCSIFIVGLFFCSIKCFGIVGKSFGFFSGVFLAAPLFGSFFSASSAALLTGALLAIKSLLFGYPITGGIPTLIATLAWTSHRNVHAQKNWRTQASYFLTHAAIPGLCMILFMTNQSVGKGYVYALYWLIPIMIYAIDVIFKRSSVFSCALSTTFIAHAVGSVLWLTVAPLPEAAWLHLIPIVAIERLMSALGMTIVFYGVQTFFSFEKRIQNFQKQSSEQIV